MHYPTLGLVLNKYSVPVNALWAWRTLIWRMIHSALTLHEWVRQTIREAFNTYDPILLGLTDGRQVELGLAFLRHLNSVDSRRVIFKLHKALELKLSTSVIEQGAALARPKLIVPVEMALQPLPG